MKKISIPLKPEEYFKIIKLPHGECGKLFIALLQYHLSVEPIIKLSDAGNEWFKLFQNRIDSFKLKSTSARSSARASVRAQPAPAPCAPGVCAGGVSNYDIHSGNLELSTDLELCTTINNNNSDDKSSTTTTTTVYNSACASKDVENFQHSEKNVENFSYDEVDQWTESVELDIMEYFAKRNFDSNAEDFIAYNKSRNWKGIGGEDVREDYVRYADRWESEERRKRGKYDWKPPII